MSNYSRVLNEEDPDYHSSVLDVYYKNRDLRLLLDFFSISAGVAPALLILASLDKVVAPYNTIPHLHILELLAITKTLYLGTISDRWQY